MVWVVADVAPLSETLARTFVIAATSGYPTQTMIYAPPERKERYTPPKVFLPWAPPKKSSFGERSIGCRDGFSIFFYFFP
jgi:hypothetical protein